MVQFNSNNAVIGHILTFWSLQRYCVRQFKNVYRKIGRYCFGNVCIMTKNLNSWCNQEASTVAGRKMWANQVLCSMIVGTVIELFLQNTLKNRIKPCKSQTFSEKKWHVTFSWAAIIKILSPYNSPYSIKLWESLLKYLCWQWGEL